MLLGCQETETAPEVVWHPVPGEIQVLNSCGIPKMAGRARDLLLARGFDVVEIGNDTWWNYDETVIAVRNPHWNGVQSLTRALGTENVIVLENPLKMVDATVYIGKDIQGLLND